MEVFEGNPAGKAVWDWVWTLPIMRRGQPGKTIEFGDVAHVLRKNIEQIYGKRISRSICPHPRNPSPLNHPLSDPPRQRALGRRRPAR